MVNFQAEDKIFNSADPGDFDANDKNVVFLIAGAILFLCVILIGISVKIFFALGGRKHRRSVAPYPDDVPTAARDHPTQHNGNGDLVLESEAWFGLSTSNDFVDRGATLLVNSATEIQLDFTKCEKSYLVSCGFTPAGGRAILKKLPNIMDANTSSSGSAPWLSH